MSHSSAALSNVAPGRIYPWFVVGVLSCVSIISYVDRQIINLLVEPIRLSLGVNDTQIGLLQGFSFALFYSILALPLARLADGGNRTQVITWGIVCFSLATFSCGLAVGFVSLFLGRMFVGVGEATLAPSGYSLLGDYFPAERVGIAVSIFTGSGFAGAGLAYIIGGYVISALSGWDSVSLPFVGTRETWQLAFMAVAIPSLALVLLMAFVREPVRRETLGAAPTERASIRAVFRHIGANRRLFLGIYLGLTLMAAGVFALNSWVPTFLIRVHEWSPMKVGSVFGVVVLLASASGILTGGALASFLMRRGIAAANLLVPLVAALLAVPLVAVFPAIPDPASSVALLAPALFFSSIPFGCGTAVLPLISPNRIRAQVVAVYLLIANLIGFTCGPTSVGFLTDYVFEDPMMVGRSLSIAPAIFLVSGALVLSLALLPYRKLAHEMLA